MIDISIIIPVYNCELYLEQCIKSIQAQTIKNIEIICIDDGSQDNSAEILHQLASGDDRIIIFRQKNQGAGNARNVGLQNACGEFVAFMDADDYYINKSGLECMISACREWQVDACASILTHDVDGIIKKSAMGELVTKNSKKGICNYKDYQLDYYFYTFIFKRSILIDKKVFFPNFIFYEDPVFLVNALYHCVQFIAVDKEVYCYRMPKYGKRFNENKCKGLLEGIITNLRFAKEHNLEMLFNRTMERLEYEYCESICYTFSTKNIEGIQLLLKVNEEIRQMKEDQNYIIRPLKKVLEIINKSRSNYRENLLTEITLSEGIYIYGAGNVGIGFYNFLKEYGMSKYVKGFFVSNKEKQIRHIDGKPVLTIGEKCINNDEKVVIAVSGFFVKEIVNVLEQYHIYDYVTLDMTMIEGVCLEQ